MHPIHFLIVWFLLFSYLHQTEYLTLLLWDYTAHVPWWVIFWIPKLLPGSPTMIIMGNTCYYAALCMCNTAKIIVLKLSIVSLPQVYKINHGTQTICEISYLLDIFLLTLSGIIGKWKCLETTAVQPQNTRAHKVTGQGWINVDVHDVYKLPTFCWFDSWRVQNFLWH